MFAQLRAVSFAARPNPYAPRSPNRNSIARNRNPRTGSGTTFRKKGIPAPVAPIKPIRRRTSPATPETGFATIKICRPRSSAAPSKAIRNSGSFRRNSKPGCCKAVAAFFQPASAAAGARAQSHGNLGAPDSRPEAAGAPGLSAVQAVAARPPPGRQPRHPRACAPDARTARPTHQLRPYRNAFSLQERGHPQRSRPPSARPRRRPASRPAQNNKVAEKLGCAPTAAARICPA
jgi:hypothetical protein